MQDLRFSSTPDISFKIRKTMRRTHSRWRGILKRSVQTQALLHNGPCMGGMLSGPLQLHHFPILAERLAGAAPGQDLALDPGHTRPAPSNQLKATYPDS